MLPLATFFATCLIDLERAGGKLLPMKAWIDFNLIPSHNFVLSCDVNISSDLLIIEMHQQGSQFFSKEHGWQETETKAESSEHCTISCCWKIIGIVRQLCKQNARSLIALPESSSASGSMCHAQNYTPPFLNICLFTNFKWAYFRVQIHSFCFVCVFPPFLNICLSRDFNK